MKKLILYDNYKLYRNDDDEVVFELNDPEILVDVFLIQEKMDFLFLVGINEQGEDVSLRLEDFDDSYLSEIYDVGYLLVILNSADGNTNYFNEKVYI